MNKDREPGGDDPLDRELVRRYQAASSTLDERPSAAARASILAAAARQVQARPAVVGAPAVRARPGRRPSWPLAAAAVVMLSTLAVMLARRTQEEMPQFSAPESPAVRARDQVAQAPPTAAPAEPARVREESALQKQSASPSAPSPSNASPSTTLPSTTSPSAVPPSGASREVQSQAASKRDQASSSRQQSEAQDSAGAVTERRQTAPMRAPAPSSAASESTSAPAASPSPSADAAPPPPPPTAPAQPKSLAKPASPAAEAPPASSALRKEQGNAAAGLQGTPTDQAAAQARGDVAGRSAPKERARAETVESAAAWLERIIRLRRDGRHGEADIELKRFRERYPQIQPPSEALPASGPQ